MSALMRNAGLGIFGVGVKEQWTLEYKPGETVTEERVMRALETMILQADKENAEFEISCPKVLYISSLNTSGTSRPSIKTNL